MASAASHDLIVIGGGINGAGIARDAALRGLDVLLLEARDFGGGTTSGSSRLIHGGLRYLEYGELPLVYESLHERRCLRRIARHLVRPLRITIPLYRGGRRAPWLVRTGMIAYDLLSIGKSLPRHRMLSRDELLAEVPGVNPSGLRAAAQYYDAQVTYAERLVIENVVAARQAGATLENYAPVTAVDTAAGITSVRYTQPSTGDVARASAPAVVNAAGPWVDRVLATSEQRHPRLMGGTKGTHIVVGAFSGAPADAFYVEAGDGRPVFILPWNGQYLIGTTDLRYDGDPADATPGRGEIHYLLDAANAVFPRAALDVGDIHYAYAGVRPLPYRAQGPESAITRRHIIHEHGAPAEGLVSVIGGKLTTYRNLAEQVVDRVLARRGGKTARCTTAGTPLPGAAGIEEARSALEASAGIPPPCRERLLAIYGGRSRALLALVEADPRLAETLDPEGTSIAAEVMLAIRDEQARTLVDIVHRRMMTGLAPDLGAPSNDAVATLAAGELGWDQHRLEDERATLAAWNRRLERAEWRAPQNALS